MIARRAFFLTCVLLSATRVQSASQPNIVLIMADDMGYGQTSYYDHPVLKTPNIDQMAQNGLRLDRFYAGAPNCSPTRATVMTGRTNDRTGVLNHGVPLRPQERTIAQILQDAGYATGHFGKWHLNGLRGAGVPIFADDIRSPGKFGFGTWLSVTNFFDRDPIMSRMGSFEEFEGDSSEIIVDEALKFIEKQAVAGTPSFSVIWYGTPHSPFVAAESDRADFGALNNSSSHHYGELVAMDRSIGTLRRQLRKLKIADNTLVWFCSDNGGLPKIKPDTVGGLRGFKGSVYEGGLRVPCVIEWPTGITTPRVSQYPACTMDILPTLCEIVGAEVPDVPLDGVSLKSTFVSEPAKREKPIGFRHTDRTAIIDNNLKLVVPKAPRKRAEPAFELYDVVADRAETNNLTEQHPDIANRLKKLWREWNASVDRSVTGLDYPEGKVIPPDPGPATWTEAESYQPFLEKWKSRPEYKRYIKR